MLINYIKIAWKVLGRNRFFTFVSLFGISLTIGVLVIVSAFLDQILNPSYPNLKNDRTLYITNVQVQDDEGSTSISGSSYYLASDYIKSLKTPEKVGFISFGNTTNTFVGNKKLQLTQKLCDPIFWEITEFQFIDGKPFDQSHIDRNEYVAVITQNTAKDYFGTDQGVIGKSIESDNTTYKVIGIVKDVPSYQFISDADIYLPYHLTKSDLKRKDLIGQYTCLLLAKDKSAIPAIKAEVKSIIPKVVFPPEAWYKHLDIQVGTKTELMSKVFTGGELNEASVRYLYLFLIAAMLLFMLLPTLNLVNLNSSRILERASEIGVRKAFGATSNTLTVQFIIENVIITLIGGLVGLVIAAVFLYIIQDSGIIPNAILSINYRVFLFGILLCLVFGILSGVIPALRMSKLSIVNAIKIK